jgi:hypothetical protein
MAVLGCFLRKKGLSWHSYVGAWYMLAPGTCWRPVHVGARHVRARYIGALLEWAP